MFGYSFTCACSIIKILLKFAFLFPSGRELFNLDSSLFVDDAEAYDKYQREEELDIEQKVILCLFPIVLIF